MGKKIFFLFISYKVVFLFVEINSNDNHICKENHLWKKKELIKKFQLLKLK